MCSSMELLLLACTRLIYNLSFCSSASQPIGDVAKKIAIFDTAVKTKTGANKNGFVYSHIPL